MLKWLKYVALIIFVSTAIAYLSVFILSQLPITNYQLPTTNKVLSKQITAYAQVGGYTINRLAGFTSPFAEVQLNSVNLARKTLANETGYFLFTNNPILPGLYELCLVSQDVNQLPSYPTCLAPPPSNQNIDIVDVLLSPSLSLGSSVISSQATVVASGMTFPNSQVSVYLFSTDDAFTLWLNKITLVKPAYAFGLPKYETKSNSDGYFEFSLPAPSRSSNRFYVASALNVGGNGGNKGDLGDEVDRTAPTQTNPALKESLASNTDHGDFIPKTNIGTQATDNEAPTIDLRESPKSNTLYFRSVGWLEGLITKILTLLKLFTGSLSNPFRLILVEMMVILILIVLLFIKINSNKEHN